MCHSPATCALSCVWETSLTDTAVIVRLRPPRNRSRSIPSGTNSSAIDRSASTAHRKCGRSSQRFSLSAWNMPSITCTGDMAARSGETERPGVMLGAGVSWDLVCPRTGEATNARTMAASRMRCLIEPPP